ncbi:MAG: hypothetical protein IT292_05190 [Deltaproteobacteria bacterium]|nr:hypothetical protein [Deltaproteobacteria bacterium]
METIAINKLIELYQVKAHSLAQYITIAEPYYIQEETPTFNAVQNIARNDAQHADLLQQILVNYTINYDTAVVNPIYTEYNYLSLHFLKARLIDDLNAQLLLIEQIGHHLSGAELQTLCVIQGETKSALALLG